MTPEERTCRQIREYLGGDNYHPMFCSICDKIQAAIKEERKEWHKLIVLLMRNLPWGALKGALLEDSRIKSAMRAEVK